MIPEIVQEAMSAYSELNTIDNIKSKLSEIYFTEIIGNYPKELLDKVTEKFIYDLFNSLTTKNDIEQYDILENLFENLLQNKVDIETKAQISELLKYIPTISEYEKLTIIEKENFEIKDKKYIDLPNKEDFFDRMNEGNYNKKDIDIMIGFYDSIPNVVLELEEVNTFLDDIPVNSSKQLIETFETSKKSLDFELELKMFKITRVMEEKNVPTMISVHSDWITHLENLQREERRKANIQNSSTKSNPTTLGLKK